MIDVNRWFGSVAGLPDQEQESPVQKALRLLSPNAAPADAPGGAAPPAPGGVSSAPPGAPPAPWEMAGANDGGQMMLKENDETAPIGGGDAMLPGDGGFAPTPEYDPRAVDEGPRESRPQPIPPTDITASDPAYTQNPSAAPVVDPLDPSTITPAALPPLPNGPRMMQPQAPYRDPREGQGIIARGIDAIGQYLPSAPIVDTKPGDAGVFMSTQPNTVGRLWEWRGRVAEGAADALSRGTGLDPDALVLNVEVGGIPIQMTVSELLENVTDPLLAAGWGVGDMVLDAAGKAVLRLVAPYAKGAARETIGRLLNSEPVQRGVEAVREGAESLGRGLQGVGREVAGGLMDMNPGLTPRIIGDGPGIGRSMPGPDDVPTPPSVGRPQQRTVEWLQEQIDYTRRVLDDLDPATEGELIGQVQDRLARLQGEWVDAVNARRSLEPRIRSEVGRRVNELPIDERTASDYAGIGRERVSPEAGIPRTVDDTPRSPGLNSAIPGFDPGAAALGAGAGVDENGEMDPWRTGAGMLFAGVAGPRAKPSPGISKLGRRVMETYAKVTPQRVADSTTRTLQIAADAIAGKIPARGGLSVSPSELVRATHEAIVRNLQDTKEVMTGLRPGALAAYMRGEGLTSKVDTGDLEQIRRITQQQVNVEGGRAQIVDGKKMKVPYTLEEAGHFAARESEQMRVATGGTRFPDPETGAIDEAAPRVMYAYVNEGQPLVGPNRPTLWLAWNDETPRITSANHPFGLTSPGQSIHDSMPPGVKAAIWAEDAIKGGRPIPGPGGAPIVADWERAGVRVAPGRKIADTNWLVGPDGEDAMRANGLLLAMPQKIQQQIAKGQLTDPEQIAAVLMRGGAPQWKPGWAAVQNTSRSESLILDPDIANIKAIYLTATPSNLASRVPNTGRGRGKNATKALTELEMAQKIRADVQAATGRDIPIYLTDISQPGRPTSMADAKLLEGTPLERPLSPGRSRIVDQYTQATDPTTGAPYTNLGSRLPFDPTSAAMGGAAGAMSEGEDGEAGDPLRTAGGMAVAGILGKNFPGVQKAIAASQRRAAAMAAKGQQPLSPLQWTRRFLGNVGYSSMIGIQTASVNLAGNLVEPPYATIKETTRAVLPQRMGGRGAPAEARAAFMGGLHGLTQTGREMWDALRARGNYASNPDQPNLSEQTINPIGHALALGTEVGGRIFSGVPDAFFGTIARHAGEAREAAQVATDAVRAGTLAKADWQKAVDMLLQDANAIRNGQPPQMGAISQQIVDAGKKYADDQTFRSELGTIGKKGEEWARLMNMPVLGNLVTPFYTTPWNMNLRRLERTPVVGAVMNTQKGFDKAFDQVAGTALLAGGLTYAMHGRVTGSGPDDPEKRKMMEQEGWRPNSTLIPWTDGRQYYVPNRVFGIYGSALNAIGETHDAIAYRKPDGSIVQDAQKRFGKLVKQEPYLQGVANILTALTDPQSGGLNQYLASNVTRMVPYASTVRAASASQDTVERDLERQREMPMEQDILQRIKSGLGMRSELPAKTDIKGQEIPNQQPGPWALLPKLSAATDDPAISHLLENDADLTQPRRYWTVTVAGAASPDGARGSVKVDMPHQQQVDWQRYRWENLQMRLDALQAIPEYATLNEAQKRQRLQTAIERANDYATRMTRNDLGGEEFNRLLEDAVRTQRKAS